MKDTVGDDPHCPRRPVSVVLNAVMLAPGSKGLYPRRGWDGLSTSAPGCRTRDCCAPAPSTLPWSLRMLRCTWEHISPNGSYNRFSLFDQKLAVSLRWEDHSTSSECLPPRPNALMNSRRCPHQQRPKHSLQPLPGQQSQKSEQFEILAGTQPTTTRRS